jgi:hypothetical protein
MKKLRIGTVREFGGEMSSRRRFATPADFPRHGCRPYRGLHARRGSVGVVPQFKGHFLHFLSPRSNPYRPIRNFFIAVW